MSEFLQPGKVAWVQASVAEVRGAPSHAAEQVSQALQGELCKPLAHQEGWLRAELPDGYQGWIRDWHLVAASESQVKDYLQGTNGRVQAPWAAVLSQPSEGAAPVAETVMGTRVQCLARQRGWVEVELPTKVTGWLREEQVRDGVDDWVATSESILSMYESFLGVPYMWGGRSPKGFDCSGLVQFVLGLHGIAVPRDSPDQFESFPRCSEDPQPGDLLFFGAPKIAHVAVQFDAQRYLHARGAVRFNSLQEGHPLYDESLARQYRGRSRLLTQMAPSGGVS